MSEGVLKELAFDQLLEKLEALEAARTGTFAGGVENTRTLIHEVRVHQVELEIQNRELREAQSLLEESRSRYVELYDAAPVGYATLGLRGSIQAINLYGATLLEIERVKLIGRSFRGMVVESDRAVFDKHLGRCLAGARDTVELSIAVKSQPSRPLELLTVPVRDPHGTVTSCHTVITDVSERRKIEADRASFLAGEQEARTLAETANRIKDDFLAVVSHELRTPLAPMMMWMKVLHKAGSDQALRAKALEVLELCLASQVKQIDDLVDVARSRTGKLRINRQPIQLVPLFSAAVAALEPSAFAKQIKVETEVPEAGVIVLGDDSRLRQVIGNLLSNAVKFTQPGGRIVLRLARDNDEAIITVSDDGEGIAAALLPHIFEPFRQQDGTPVRRHEGLGLGLSIVKELVGLHDGSVSGASAGKNRGSTFTVRLPISKDQRVATPAASTPPPLPASDESALRGVRILVIEDQQQTREVLAMILGWVGASVTVAESAASGRTALARAPVDVVICDVAMPEEDGYTFVGKRRRQEREQSMAAIPVLALTAHASADDRRRALDAGFDLHLAKPIDPEKLIAAIARFTRGNRREAPIRREAPLQ